jgi:hypothetical protein
MCSESIHLNLNTSINLSINVIVTNKQTATHQNYLNLLVLLIQCGFNRKRNCPNDLNDPALSEIFSRVFLLGLYYAGRAEFDYAKGKADTV